MFSRSCPFRRLLPQCTFTQSSRGNVAIRLFSGANSTASLHLDPRKQKEPLSPLAMHLRDLIRVSGPLSVAQYIRQSLTHPLGGYYMKGDVFGRSGDFTTAPEISQMFGEMIAIWFISHWHATGQPKNVQFVELGPGRGTLMADILRTALQIPAFRDAVKRVNLIEASKRLRDMQSQKLNDGPLKGAFEVTWHDSIDGVSNDDGSATFLVANEFFDALPIYQFERAADGWREIMVDIDDSKETDQNFRLVLSPGATKASVTLLNDPRYDKYKTGERIEVSPESSAVAEKIGSLVGSRSSSGAALVIDYGKNHIMGDSLRCIRKHKFVPLLSFPGDADISADVDFSFLAQGITRSGAAAHGPVTQGHFLKMMGIENRMNMLSNTGTASPSVRDDMRLAVQRLVGSAGGNGMGEIYKVMAVTDASVGVPHPFH